MKIAVIADIHGNAVALEAVLADIAVRGVDRVINLGDVVSGPLWPRETMDLLSGRDWLTIRGNHDRWVAGGDPAAKGALDRFAVTELDLQIVEQRAYDRRVTARKSTRSRPSRTALPKTERSQLKPGQCRSVGLGFRLRLTRTRR
jgi:predicted phosphodiesterase